MRPTLLAALLLPALLAGCDALYDDTKGWANRLEASLLSDGSDRDEGADEAAAPPAAKPEPTPAPPAVPLTPVAVTPLAQPAPQPPAPDVAAPEPAAPEPAATPPLPKPKPAVPAPDAAVVAVVLHLSSLRSEEAARRQWSDLQKSHPEPLGALQAEFRRTELGGQGTFYRVLAGPLPSSGEASAVCDALKAKDSAQYCRILPQEPKA